MVPRSVLILPRHILAPPRERGTLNLVFDLEILLKLSLLVRMKRVRGQEGLVCRGVGLSSGSSSCKW